MGMSLTEEAGRRMPEHTTILHSITDAVTHIERMVNATQSHARQVIVIGGPVGSGKSTLAHRLGGLVLSTDEYLPDYEGLAEHERDEPIHADLPRLARDLARLRDTGTSTIPKWCFQTHRRIGEQEVTARGAVICEGIFALHPALAHLTTLRILIDADPLTRWKRWERIEFEGQRGMGVEAAREHFNAIAEPTYRKYAHLYESGLDLIVRNETA